MCTHIKKTYTNATREVFIVEGSLDKYGKQRGRL